MVTNFGNVVLLWGGPSEESSVSKMSCDNITDIALGLKMKGQIERLYHLEFSHTNFLSKIKLLKPDIVLNCMHGDWGEDGRVPLLLDEMKVKYTSSGNIASNIAINKTYTNSVVESLGISVPKSRLISAPTISTSKSILKPNSGGSSIGIQVVEAGVECVPDLAIDKFWILQDFVQGDLIEVTVLGDRAFTPVQVVCENYDFNTKYVTGADEYRIPPSVKDDLVEICKDSAVKIHRAIGCRGFSRTAFIVSEGVPFFIEINTHPGFTNKSLMPMSCTFDGMSQQDMIIKLLEEAQYD